jgi:8-oxo-dGTP pyrophosphatase MutT (NUDIX family)
MIIQLMNNEIINYSLIDLYCIMSEAYPNARTIAAGVLPFFDEGRTILLGQEYRKNFDAYYWMEFGGKQEPGQSLA